MTAGQFTGEASPKGEFIRQPNHFRSRITDDGSSEFPVEAGRYVLYVSLACPWAHRSVIVRRLLGLEDALGLRVVDPLRDERGWRFTLDAGDVDPVTGAGFAMELYRRSDPSFEGRATVPFVWDTASGQIVTNDYPQITLDLSTQWSALHRPDAPDLYPEHLRAEIDLVAEANFSAVNNGVYQAGFATSQSAYEAAYDALFVRLDELEQLLAGQRYLVGGQLTETDVRLYTTLARFDSAYHGHFKCNRQKLSEYDALWAYARDLWQTPGFGDTTDQAHIKAHLLRDPRQDQSDRHHPEGPGHQLDGPPTAARPSPRGRPASRAPTAVRRRVPGRSTAPWCCGSGDQQERAAVRERPGAVRPARLRLGSSPASACRPARR